MSSPATERETPRRLRAADVIETLETALTNVTNRPTGEPSATVELSRNAKGEVQFSVKVSASAHADAADVERATAHAYDQATQAFEALRALHPFGPPDPHEAELKQVKARTGSIAANVAKGNTVRDVQA